MRARRPPSFMPEMASVLAEDLRRVMTTSKTIAVVGASADESKSSHTVPRYLQEHGYRIVPVNPSHGSILGEKAFPSLRDVDVPIDVVQVFRPGHETPEIARAAVAVGAKVLWLQPGILSEEAGEIARSGGLEFFQDVCMRATHIGLGLG